MNYQKSKKCDFCHALEGQPRPVGNYLVRLTTIDVHGIKKEACQSCAHKNEAILLARRSQKIPANYLTKSLMNVRNFTAMVLHLGILLVIFSMPILAQPPGLPGNPSQAPIDGGLSLLAVAGGAYGLKKLRDRKNME